MSKPNLDKKAVALRYDKDKASAPIVSAKGKGYIAEEILKRAKKADIPIQEDKSLVALLSELNINEQIPDELYHAVAEVFSYIYHIDQQQKEKLSKR